MGGHHAVAIGVAAAAVVWLAMAIVIGQSVVCTAVVVLGDSKNPSAAAAAGGSRDRGGWNLLLGIAGLQGEETSHGRSKGLQVIGAGLPKSGTKSLQMALERLGHRIYDFQTVMSTPGHKELVPPVFVDNRTGEVRGHYPDDKRIGDPVREAALDAWHSSMLDTGATAVLDHPLCFLFEELLQRNPNAKVILSMRPPPRRRNNNNDDDDSEDDQNVVADGDNACLLYTSPSPRDRG